MSSDDIQWLVAQRGVPRKIAADAYRDAEKAAKARRPKGFAALDTAAQGPSVRDEALKLLDEPARQPAAVEALARVKRESKQPIAACRAALAEAGYDADRALALLGARPAPAKSSKVPKPAKPAVKVNHLLHAMSGRSAEDVVLIAKRMRVLTNEERRLHPHDRIYHHDCCVVYRREGVWQRKQKPGGYDDVWVSGDGRVTLLRDGAILTLEQVVATQAKSFVPEGGKPLRLVGRDGIGEIAFDPFRSKKQVIWWREPGKDWGEVPQPASISSPLHVEVTKDRIWLAGWGRTIASYDGQGWKDAAVDHGTSSASGTFDHFAVSPSGRVLASREGRLYEGDLDQITYVHHAGDREVSSIAWFGDRFWVGHTRLGICRWDGGTLVPVATIGKLRGFDKDATIRLSARDTLLAMSPAELLESTDGVTFRSVTTSREIGEVIGSEDVYWATIDPAKLPISK